MNRILASMYVQMLEMGLYISQWCCVKVLQALHSNHELLTRKKMNIIIVTKEASKKHE